ncbi:hypothetical protein VTO73DRAFT_7547 [Trametes versicolor]
MTSQPDPAENWDEDFEIAQSQSQASGSHSPPRSSSTRQPTSPGSPTSPSRRRRSTATGGPPSAPSTPLSKDKKNTVPLRQWAEPGPSTPSKAAPAPPQLQMENWDDDFQDTDSPGPAARRRNTAATHPLEAPTERPGEVENWDDDFEDGGGGGGGSEGARTAGGASPGRRRTPRKRGSWPSSDEEDDDDGEYGFGDGEDRTVTSRTRGAGMGMHIPFQLPVDHPPMPPLPPMPSPFPRSPTASVFSVPVSSTTGRESVTGYSYSSTAHLALRPTLSGGSAARLALLPPSPPIHRERRRLRKKSRPPPNFEDGIFELDDRAEIVDPPMARPVTPEQKKPSPGADEPSAYDAANTTAPASSGKTPLLSRIGSVGKKWNAGRKKRVSTGPTEVALHEATAQAESGGSSRPTSFIASTSPGSAGGRNWFFRAGGGGHGPQGSPPRREGALKSEKSVERLLHLMRAEQRGLVLRRLGLKLGEFPSARPAARVVRRRATPAPGDP